MDEKENKNTDNTFDVPQDISYPEPHFIIEDVYGGPQPPEFDNEPVMCVYGPPEPGFLSDNDIILDDPHYGSEDISKDDSEHSKKSYSVLHAVRKITSAFEKLFKIFML